MGEELRRLTIYLLRSFLLQIVLFAVAILPAWARPHSHSLKPDKPVEPGYVYALAAANHFLQAWQTGDLESGMVELSDGIRRSQSAELVEHFFSEAKDRAYEITRGHGQVGRYTFPVVLFDIRGLSSTRKISQIVMMETGKNDWVVDRLP
jgi:hypothetical protein